MRAKSRVDPINELLGKNGQDVNEKFAGNNLNRFLAITWYSAGYDAGRADAEHERENRSTTDV